MTKILKKLKDNTGASLILVMVLFLMCVMVSSVIVVTASTGASRGQKRKEQQQRYLSLMSAVNLVSEEMKNSGTYIGETTLHDFGCNKTGELQHRNDEKEPIHEDEKPICSDLTETSYTDPSEVWHGNGDALSGMFKEILDEACTTIFVNRELEYKTYFKIIPNDDRLMTVHCKFVMDDYYDVAVYFSTDGGTTYVMTLKCQGAPDRGDPSAVEFPEEDSHYMTFLETDEETGEVVENTDWNPLGEIRTTIITSITWEKQELRKGGE